MVGQVVEAARRLATGWMVRVRSRVLGGGGDFSSLLRSRLDLGTTQSPIK